MLEEEEADISLHIRGRRTVFVIISFMHRKVISIENLKTREVERQVFCSKHWALQHPASSGLGSPLGKDDSG